MRAPSGVGRRRLPAVCSLPFSYERPTVKSRCQVYGLEPEVHFNLHLSCGESWTCSYPRSSFPAPWNALSHRYQCPLATIPMSPGHLSSFYFQSKVSFFLQTSMVNQQIFTKPLYQPETTIEMEEVRRGKQYTVPVLQEFTILQAGKVNHTGS